MEGSTDSLVEDGILLHPLHERPTSQGSLRIVLFGASSSLADNIPLFASQFKTKVVSQISVPETEFEAGLCCASADILIFDLSALDFGSLLDTLRFSAIYNPRALTVALLEPGAGKSSLPDCGLQLMISRPFTSSAVAKSIESCFCA